MSRQRAGFTLIELLIVVVIIGILAAIAIPKYQNTKGKAHLAAMRSDLHNLSVAQEGYYYINQVYSTALPGMDFNASPGVQITINEATGSGWSATSTSAVAYPHTCAIFVGNAAPVSPAVTAGVVGCN